MSPSGFAFQRVAIVNRGEPAMRLINAVREWNAEGRPALRVIAVYTAADRHATFVREADEAVLIGPGPESEADAAFAGSPYLDYAELERALRACRADAVWPGWGFVSEKAEFAELCDRLGIIFIGPSAEVMRRLGDKIESKLLAEQAEVPLAPWSGGPVPDLAAAREAAESIGYPLMVKATAGGGGRGIRMVRAPEDLEEAFERASSEASKTAGDATVFLERAIRGGRHVEVQVVADAEGTVWTLGVRDCSVQRRNQKVIEESASTALDAEQEKLLRGHAAELVRAAGYVNAGTVEFLYEPGQKLLSFLEVNTRLQVEHPVTEACTGTDIVKLQLHIAAGGTLAEIAPAEPPARGHAIEARLTAEDPERDFAPAPGLIEHLALPAGPGIRVDTGVAPGDVIPPQFDSMIAKVIAWGQDRAEARARLSRAIRQTSTVIQGGTTSKAFLLDLLDRPEFVRGEIDTTWLDTMMAEGYAPPLRVDVALLATAFEAYEAHERRQQDRLFTSAERGRPEVGHETRHQVDVRVGGEAYKLGVSRSRPERYQVELDDRSVEVDVDRAGRFELRLAVGGQTFDVLSVAQGPDYLVEVDGAVHRISGGEAGLVRAPAPAMVVAVSVAAGDEVTEGDVVAVVESMKLETSLRAPASGRVAEVFADVNTQVESGAKLLRIEPAADEGAEAEAAGEDASRVRADLDALDGEAAADEDPAAVAADALVALRALMLGFDVDEAEAGRQLQRLAAARAELPADDPRLLAGEARILQIFADVSALWRSRRVPGESQADDEAAVDDEAARNPQEYMHAYLRSRDADAEGLPESFRIKLRRTLAHYGVDGLEPSPGLDPALYRIFLARRRAAAYVPVVSELLQWRLDHPGSLPDDGRDDYRRTIDQLVSATQLRHPGVGDLARQVRYRCFDAPLIAAERARGQQQVRAELDRLSPDPAARAAQIDAMVASGEPILGVFTERHDPVMLEVMTRRYYRIRSLRNVQVTERSGRPLVTAEYTHDGHEYLIVATVAAGAESAAATDLPELIQAIPAGRTVLVDLYVTSQTAEEDGSGAPDARADRIRGKLGPIPPAVDRVAVAVRRPDGEGGGWPDWFTFRGGPDGQAVEDRTQRGWHPLVAERLGVWRFSGFELTRLPADPDVHLFRIQGCENRDDQRLMALADVRELTIVRDDAGRITGLPQLERILDACLDSLRSARSADRGLARLDWNRIMLYVWPTVEAPLTELGPVIRSLAARTGALGLEQVMVQFRDAEGRERMLRMSRQPGAGPDAAGDRPAARAAARAERVHAERDPGPPPRRRVPVRAHPADHPLAGSGRRGRRVHRVRPGRGRRPGAGGPGARFERREPGARRGQHADEAVPGGDAPGGAAGRPDPGAGRAGRAGVPADPRGHRAGAAAARPGRVVRHLGRREDRDGLRHRDHGLDLPGAAGDRRVHPGRRRDQRGGDRHQRGRPAVLERRGDDAHAHQRRADHDAGLGHGADRKAVAGLLGRRLGRGQLRHRRLRPDHGAERRGPVLGARPVQRGRRAARALRARLRGAGRAVPPAVPDRRPRRPGHLLLAARRPGVRRARRDLRPGDQPGTQEAL